MLQHPLYRANLLCKAIQVLNYAVKASLSTGIYNPGSLYTHSQAQIYPASLLIVKNAQFTACLSFFSWERKYVMYICTSFPLQGKCAMYIAQCIASLFLHLGVVYMLCTQTISLVWQDGVHSVGPLLNASCFSDRGLFLCYNTFIFYLFYLRSHFVPWHS
jgi:hypothetical protein